MKNMSGLRPVEYKVLVKPEDVPKMIGKVHLTDEYQDRQAMAQGRGVLIAAGSLAFEEWGDAPLIGSQVIFPKYAGFLVEEKDTADGKAYRLFNDKEIVAVRE
jgi:co-chaperonin GroES (HSP10)